MEMLHYLNVAKTMSVYTLCLWFSRSVFLLLASFHGEEKRNKIDHKKRFFFPFTFCCYLDNIISYSHLVKHLSLHENISVDKYRQDAIRKLCCF